MHPRRAVRNPTKRARWDHLERCAAGQGCLLLVRWISRQKSWIAEEFAMDAGLIGLGRMGAGIAKSLLRAGHRLTVYNRTRSRAEALRENGASVAASPAEACSSGLVFTMVAD